MTSLEIPTRLRENFVAVCHDLRLDANHVLEQILARFVASPPQSSLEKWAQKFIGDVTLPDDAKLVDGLSVRDYFALPKEQRNSLWEKWEQEAEQKLNRVTARGVARDANAPG